jgi:hypothetical protein
MTPTQAAIDLSPIINNVLVPLVATGLSGVAAWVLGRVAAYFHFQLSQGQRQVVSDAIDNGIALAVKRLGPVTINADQHVAEVVNYVLPKVPDALKHLGVTPDHLAEVIAAKMPAPPGTVSLAPIAA